MTSPDTPTQRLFREELLDQQGQKLLGDIVLTPKASMLWVSIGAALIGLAVIALLVFGSYTRRTTVTGQLVPVAGLMRVHTPQTGVVLEKKVNEGQLVKKGDVLYVLTSDRIGEGARELQADIGAQVTERRRSMEAEIARNSAAESGEIGNLERRAATQRAEVAAIQRQIEQQKLRLQLAQDASSRYQGLADKDYIAKEQLFQKQMELSEQQSRLGGLQKDVLVAQRELATTVREVENTRLRYGNQNALLGRSMSSAAQELTEVEGRRRVVVTAPQAGRATLVLAEVGQVVDATKPLLNIVPDGAPLEVRLYAPSRAIGFIRNGDRVLLRYAAFPYQKFGQHEGRVTSVSNSTAASTEVAGFTTPEMAQSGEPVYAITVALDRQTITTYGQARPLQAGMRVEADVLQESRRLYEWMLEPLYSISGKL